MNLEFWGSDSVTAHSIYAGSYGRGTATDYTSDVDLVCWLPTSYYHTYNQYSGNGQSALLQACRSALRKTYATSDIGADGQVVVVAFADGITFEVLPSFENTDNSFTYADSNGGGSWKTTDPRPEAAEMSRVDGDCGGNLRRLCQMSRAWKHHGGVPIKGLLLDTLAYNFIRAYTHRDKTFVYYDYLSRDFLKYVAEQNRDQQYWAAPGSSARVWRIGSFEYKAKHSHAVAEEACGYQGESYGWTARRKWREIFGTAFPS